MVVVGCVGLAIALLALVLTLPSRPEAPLTEVNDVPSSFGAPPVDDSPFSADELASAFTDDGHPVYRHSVVAGGVHSLDDVERAVDSDPVVREHYSRVSIANLKVVRTPARREAYMSYRVGDRVYWTSKKIALAEGEAVLTDGTTTIRARCGNLVSDEAMVPTLPQEPASSVFDSIQPGSVVASSAETPGIVSDAFDSRGVGVPGPSQSALTTGTPGGSTNSSSNLGSSAVGGAGGVVSPGGSRRPTGEGGSSDSSLPSDSGSNPPNIDNPATDNPPTFGGGPGGGDNPPGFYDPPWEPPFGDGPGGPGGPGGGPDNPGGPDIPPVFVPEQPPIDTQTPPEVVPVPEPASLVLFGSGLALTAWQVRRRQQSKKDS